MEAVKKQFKKNVAVSLVILFMVFAGSFLLSIHNVFAQDTTQETTQTQVTKMDPARADVMKFALVAAALAFGLGALGAGIAIAHVGAAAMGAIGEKPEMAGQALIFIALGEGLVVFGFITALMILGRV
ncbi:MAG: ATP synthase subunit C [Spirochaetia bacterium]|jgi:V/A-type H+-transporting ATPase subunit K